MAVAATTPAFPRKEAAAFVGVEVVKGRLS
jgi:hypothetical protein